MEELLAIVVVIGIAIVGANLALGIGLCFGAINPTKWKKGLLTATATAWGIVLGGGTGLLLSDLFETGFLPIAGGVIIGAAAFPILTYRVPGVNRFVLGFLVTMKLAGMLISSLVQIGGMDFETAIPAMFAVPLIAGILAGLFLMAWTQMRVSAFVYACAFIGASQLAPMISEAIGYLLAIATGDPSYAFGISDLLALFNIEITDIWTFISMAVLMFFGIRRQIRSLKEQGIPLTAKLITYETANREKHGSVDISAKEEGGEHQEKDTYVGRIGTDDGTNKKDPISNKVWQIEDAVNRWVKLRHPLKEEIFHNLILFLIPVFVYLLLEPILMRTGDGEIRYFVYEASDYCAIVCFIYSVYYRSKGFCAVWPVVFIAGYFVIWGTYVFDYFTLYTLLDFFKYFVIWIITVLTKKFIRTELIGIILSFIAAFLLYEVLLGLFFGYGYLFDIGYVLNVLASVITIFLLWRYYKENRFSGTGRRKAAAVLLIGVGAPLLLGAAIHFAVTYSAPQTEYGYESGEEQDDNNYLDQEWSQVPYILPDSDKKLSTENDLENLSEDELRIARNEIFARHGRKFFETDLQEYFDSKSWYYGSVEPEAFDEMVLSDIERENVKAIQYCEGTLKKVRNKSFKLIGMRAEEIEEKYGELINGYENGYPGSGGETAYSVGETGLFVYFSDYKDDLSAYDGDAVCTAVEGLPSAFFYNVDDDVDLEELAGLLEKEIKTENGFDYIEVSDGNWLSVGYRQAQEIMWVSYTKPRP